MGLPLKLPQPPTTNAPRPRTVAPTTTLLTHTGAIHGYTTPRTSSSTKNAQRRMGGVPTTPRSRKLGNTPGDATRLARQHPCAPTHTTMGPTPPTPAKHPLAATDEPSRTPAVDPNRHHSDRPPPHAAEAGRAITAAALQQHREQTDAQGNHPHQVLARTPTPTAMPNPPRQPTQTSRDANPTKHPATRCTARNGADRRRPTQTPNRTRRKALPTTTQPPSGNGTHTGAQTGTSVGDTGGTPQLGPATSQTTQPQDTGQPMSTNTAGPYNPTNHRLTQPMGPTPHTPGLNTHLKRRQSIPHLQPRPPPPTPAQTNKPHTCHRRHNHRHPTNTPHRHPARTPTPTPHEDNATKTPNTR